MPHHLGAKSIFSCDKPNKEYCHFTDERQQANYRTVLGLDTARVKKHHWKPGESLARAQHLVSFSAILGLYCMRRLSRVHAGADFLQRPQLGGVRTTKKRTKRLPGCNELDECGALREIAVKGFNMGRYDSARGIFVCGAVLTSHQTFPRDGVS